MKGTAMKFLDEYRDAEQARKLAGMFQENFAQYNETMDPAVTASGPTP